MDGSSPRAGGPTRRRTFTPAEKLEHLADYARALENDEAGVYLRRRGLYPSPITEWRRLQTNPLERVSKEIKRRTDVVGVFPNPAALLRLAGPALVETLSTSLSRRS